MSICSNTAVKQHMQWSSQKRDSKPERIKESKPNTTSYSEEEAEGMRNGRIDYMDREMENFYLYLKGTDMVGAPMRQLLHCSPFVSLFQSVS